MSDDESYLSWLTDEGDGVIVLRRGRWEKGVPEGTVRANLDWVMARMRGIQDLHAIQAAGGRSHEFFPHRSKRTGELYEDSCGDCGWSRRCHLGAVPTHVECDECGEPTLLDKEATIRFQYAIPAVWRIPAHEEIGSPAYVMKDTIYESMFFCSEACEERFPSTTYPVPGL